MQYTYHISCVNVIDLVSKVLRLRGHMQVIQCNVSAIDVSYTMHIKVAFICMVRV